MLTAPAIAVRGLARVFEGLTAGARIEFAAGAGKFLTEMREPAA